MELSKFDDSSNERKKASQEHGQHTFPEEPRSKITLNGHSSDEGSTSFFEGHRCPSRSFKRSKTHDCIREIGLQQVESPGYRDGTKWRHQHKLVSSVSFPGLKVPLRLLPENRDTSGSSCEIIDYRNTTPQMPFVTCIAKSVPKKKISLQKPRMTIKDLFVPKRHRIDKAMSPSTPSHVTVPKNPILKKTKKVIRHRRYCTAGSKYKEELTESASDSSSECFANVCEDAASLKSFGSLAGCGEIFADDLVSPEGVLSSALERVTSCPLTEIPTTAGFQGGTECLASPGNPDVLDMLEVFKTLNKPLMLEQSANAAGNSRKPLTSITKSPSTTTSEDIPLNTALPLEFKNNQLNTDLVTHKSDNFGNTSDEGYCDNVSPGFEENSRGSLTPDHSRKIPRDTYSGDALYELFSDAEIAPIYCNEVDLTNSIIGKGSDLPLSMYSFNVGAEENLAPNFSQDILGHEILESKWTGKDCLLKLCDTEIAMTMGIVNWLRQRTDKSDLTEIESSHPSGEEKGNTCTRYKRISTRAKKPPKRSKSGKSRGDTTNFKDSSLHKVCSWPVLNKVMSTLASPQSQPNTPTSGLCFRILNIDSPMSPGGDLQSLVVSSPGSATRSLFVLAINKESLCESCKGSLKSGAKNLHLCHSCISLIEHIKTSDIIPHSTLFPQPKERDLVSPTTTYGIRSDISIASLVEQCASQFSSMNMNLTQAQRSCEIGDVLIPEQGLGQRKHCSQKKSKHKKSLEAKIERRERSSRELKNLSFSENAKPHPLENDEPDGSQATRPTSLPLVASTSSQLPWSEDSMKNEEGRKFKKNLLHNKNCSMNHDKSCSVFQGERVKRRLKKKK
ncbi:hypothetical protein DNTS_029402 [Danionella cerebrum]|uniref:Uncharacterized protein n=1 Tax=Danionella cerebrum TaxID=2873325 RepID=A0A553QV89_9TELE|nr:hypothetical protein DNTS_029402 [Danionella translucida]